MARKMQAKQCFARWPHRKVPERADGDHDNSFGTFRLNA
jgi:hypothetical protein